MSVNELKEYFEGPLNEEGVSPNTPEVSHVSQLVPGQRAFLAPQIGILKNKGRNGTNHGLFKNFKSVSQVYKPKTLKDKKKCKLV